MKYFSPLKPKLIYVFRINDAGHKGCLKIGETTFEDGDITLPPNSSALNKAAKKRIDQYTQTAGIPYDLLYTELTLFVHGTVRSFNDKEVHEVLLRSGVKRKVFDHVNNANEWFETDLETVKNAIKAVKEGRKSLFTSEVSVDKSPIIFRPEQQEAIAKTLKQFKKSNQMLWNAKMRFGKTLSALQVVKEHGHFRRVLILTHRPVVDASWFEDFGKIFYDTPDFLYGSKNNGESYEYLEHCAAQGKCRYVYFASMQDLRGSELVGGNFDKNNEVFATPWDLLIVDEAHEGTQTKLGKAVTEELTKKDTKVLRLSGTPFNLLNDFKEDEIYTWDYVMEQRAKRDWDLLHPLDHNPYAELPRLNIYTYDLGRLMYEFIDEDIAFNFREFFRTKKDGTFIHEKDVVSFLNLLSKEDEESMYPFANPAYRDIFRHTLWMLPGVKAAKALSALLKAHPVFSCFEVVNVAGDGDEDEENGEALQMVEKAIGKAPDETRTITLSCGRLTTGVSVKPWTGVLMLSGSYSTSASSYMQTIFRVQTPATINGRVKEDCYVFDFAPDRTLKVLAETAKISTKAGKQGDSDRKQLGDFLNFCPIISIEGSTMQKFDVDNMLQQLKRVYVERVVNNGFEDTSLYNDELLKLTNIELMEFKELQKTIGQTKAMAKTNEVDVNRQGLTDEEYAEVEELEKKKKKKKEELTEAEKKRLEELKEKRKNKENAISILRGISIRMPLLIYGADIEDEDKELTIDNFTQLVDPQSWEEFMPKGVSKQRFNTFKKYYDPDIFAAAGKRIRQMARAADNLTIEERIERIATIFGTFRNPDKETVLTPWRVVNMHMSDCLGGYCFYDEDFKEPLLEPRFVSRGDVTDDVFSPDSHLLEINSKSGLYPLYLAYNIYRSLLRNLTYSPETLEEHLAVWDMAVAEHIFVICKTPMAKSITRRTLLGFRKGKVNTRYFEDLINQIKNKPDNFIAKVVKGKSFWKANDNDNMKFKAIVGNPPYTVNIGTTKDNYGIPLYNKFIDISKRIQPLFISMITPSRWMTGGRGLDEFRKRMLSDTRLKYIKDFATSRDCFANVDIPGGVSYFLWDKAYKGQCEFVRISNAKTSSLSRDLGQFEMFLRENELLAIIEKVNQNGVESIAQWVSSQTPFGFTTTYQGALETFPNAVTLHTSRGVNYVALKDVTRNQEWVSKYKVIFSKATCEHAGQPDKNGRYRILSVTKILKPNEVCSQSYLVGGVFENETQANNYLSYLKTQFVRALVLPTIASQDVSSDKFTFVPMQDFTPNSDIDWNKTIYEIDAQLYAKYGLTNDEIGFIDSIIRPME